MKTIGNTQYTIAIAAIALMGGAAHASFRLYLAVLAVAITAWFAYSRLRRRKSGG